MKTTLVVMAAGMGSRFGGLKQIEPITPNGRVILDFSVYDAIKAGFDNVVFIIKKEIEEDFKKAIGDRLSEKLDISYVYQECTNLPEGRKKPWGTTHAVLCCKDAVKNPFAIINADDYYGQNAFKNIHDHLVNAKGFDFSMVPYELNKTLSDNGAVTRGVCKIEDGYLKDIEEIQKIEKQKYFDEDDNQWHELPEETYVSMNIWGLTPDIFPLIEKEFEDFLKTADLSKAELLIPNSIKKLLKEKTVTVKALPNFDKWYGITYKEDLPKVKEAINKYVEEGMYPGI